MKEVSQNFCQDREKGERKGIKNTLKGGGNKIFKKVKTDRIHKIFALQLLN